METTPAERTDPTRYPPLGLSLRLLGAVELRRNGVSVPLARSRKVRALLAFLALERRGSTRSRLCDLLWDVPSDPRGELRWCLSKLRAVLDDPERRRVLATEPDSIALDLSDCRVDAAELDEAVTGGLEHLSHERLAALCELLGGELLEGLELDVSPEFSAWLSGQRQRYHALHLRLLDVLVTRTPPGSEERFHWLAAWLRLAPFDQHAHEALLEALLESGRAREAAQHVAATVRAFEEEGLDWSALRAAWQAARAKRPEASANPLPATPGPAVATTPPAAPLASAPRPRPRGSIAVMPFSDVPGAQAPERARLADGLTEDIITRLAKLRVLFVIARGSVYALGERGIGAQEAGRLLNVEYLASGSVRPEPGRIAVHVELVETQSERIVWTDTFVSPLDQTLSVLDSIVDRIVAAIAEEIESAECKRSLLQAPSSLDAWEAYHRGLWHMYRFNGPDNLHAEQFFRKALELDPSFARAFAGLSFSHFQNAFLSLTGNPERQIELALETAVESLRADDRDPAAHWAMGRALWLHRKNDESLAELNRSIELSPNFALGHYTLGFVHSQAGDPRTAIEATDHSRRLSPFDPLQFAMLAARALAHIRLGELDEAADWAVKATSRPNSHVHILAIAAQSLALVQRRDEARQFVARIRQRSPAYDVESLLQAFRFDRDTEALLRRSARQIGFGPPRA